MSTNFKIKENLPKSVQAKIVVLQNKQAYELDQVEADFLLALNPYLTNKVISYDADGLILEASGNSLPTGDTGFGKGSRFTLKNATGNGSYINVGDETGAVWLQQDVNSNTGAEALPEAAEAPVNAVAATVALTSDNTNVSADDEVVVGDQTYVYVEAFTTDPATVPNEVLIGADADESLGNLVKAIKGTGTEGVEYSVGTESSTEVTAGAVASHAFAITALVKGVIGNAIAVSTTAAHLTFGVDVDALSGGVDGTVANKGDTVMTSTYLYVASDDNTIADANWRRVALGSAY